MAEEVIDYLNSIDIPSCLLVSSIEDLKSGIPLLDLLAYFGKKSSTEGIIRKNSKLLSKKDLSLNNICIALKALNLSYKPENVYDNQDLLISVYKSALNFSTPQNTRKILEFESPENSPKSISNKKHGDYVLSSIKREPKLFENSDVFDENTFVHPSPTPIQTNSTNVRPVSENSKFKVIEWLQSLRITPTRKDLKDIPDKCRDGVLLCEILNRIGGRTVAITGYEKNPKSMTAMRNNIQKALKYLRSFPKFSSKFLWDVESILSADPYASWHLLEDIQNFFPKYIPRNSSLSLTRKHLSSPTERIKTNMSPFLTQSFMTNKTKLLASRTSSPRSVTPSTIYPRSTSHTNSTTPVHFETETITFNSQQRIKSWLQGLELAYLLDFQHRHFLQDPLRNGVLLCEVIGVLEQEVPFIRNPICVDDVRKNIDNSLNILQMKRVPIPSSVLRNKDNIIQGMAESI